VEVPRDSDGNITKWVEGMRTCRCGINGGKHLFKDCPVGGKPPSEQAARVAPHETEAPPPAATKSTIKSTDALTPDAILRRDAPRPCLRRPHALPRALASDARAAH
jgi:hypothetical protein